MLKLFRNVNETEAEIEKPIVEREKQIAWIVLLYGVAALFIFNALIKLHLLFYLIKNNGVVG